MFKIDTPTANRINIELIGKLDSNSMKMMLDELITKAEKIECGRMLYTLTEFDLPSIGAVGVELLYLPELFSLIKKFERAAVLSDKKWVRKLSELEGCLIPSIDIKAFALDEKEHAENWLNEF